LVVLGLVRHCILITAESRNTGETTTAGSSGGVALGSRSADLGQPGDVCQKPSTRTTECSR
jgi:hypothetical protein